MFLPCRVVAGHAPFSFADVVALQRCALLRPQPQWTSSKQGTWGTKPACPSTANIPAYLIVFPRQVVAVHVAWQLNLLSGLQSLRQEGPRVLFRGWTPSFIRLLPSFIIVSCQKLLPRRCMSLMVFLAWGSRLFP